MSDPHVLEPGLAPTPFTADEIRAGCPDGRTIRLLVEADGATALRMNRFRDGDAEGTTLERAALTPDGAIDGDVDHARVTWLGLQRHAAIPEEVATIEPDTIELPIGTLDCLRYTIVDGVDADIFWFAPTHPGMPVRYLSGTQTVTMVADVG